MYLSEIPGYTRACKRADRLEDYWRDFAHLGLDVELRFAGGRPLKVRMLTLRMFVQLSAVRSPFIVGGIVGPEHVAQILWRLSPLYGNPELRKEFVASIADRSFRSAVRAIGRYIDRMLTDKPPVPPSSGVHSDTGFAAGTVHVLAKEYGWSDDTILDLPMPRLFQYMRRIHRSNDPDLPYFNPLRDRFAKRITDKYLNNGNAS